MRKWKYRKKRHQQLPLHRYQQLHMGLVEACCAYVPYEEIPQWQKRGFITHRQYPIFLSEKEDRCVPMLGIAQKLERFGIGRLRGAQVLGCHDHGGSYGMGGPGFLQINLKEASRNEEYSLSFAVWSASEYVLIDDALLSAHPAYEKEYQLFGMASLQRKLEGAVIRSVSLYKHRLVVYFVLQSERGEMLKMEWIRHDLRQAPMGNGEARKPAYQKGVMNDVCLVCHANSILMV
ncbi:MAG: hypothetical protein ACRCWR_11995 [Saezia sp.]